jgi:transcription antitermination protein NusB
MAVSRRHAREIALQILYQLDVQEHLTVEQASGLFWAHFDEVERGDESARTFADQLVRGVRENLVEVDALLARASRNWRLERMARVDRNLLRLAAYELKYCADVPAKVAINEAIEIAKRFGTAESPAFVNGVLDRCLEEVGALRPER